MVAAFRDFQTGVTPAVRRIGYGYSSDGGATWSPDALLPFVSTDYPHNTDPSVCVDTGGNFHIATMALDSGDVNEVIVVYLVAENGGFTNMLTFAPSDTAGSHNDKEYIDSDLSPSSPYLNNMYMAFNSAAGIGFTRSTDGGSGWSNAFSISDDSAQSGNSGPDVAVGKNGFVHVVWDHLLRNGLRYALYNRSTDGGATFGQEVALDSARDANPVGFFGNFPSIACDISDGPRGGNIYTVWSDRRNSDPDVFIRISTDGGDHWSKARRVNDDPVGNGKQQFWPWIAVDNRGVVSVVYYDTRNTPDSTTTETYLAYSWDGGVTFTNRLISSAQSPHNTPNGSVRFGDYIGIDSWGGHTVPVWTDERAGGFDEEIYTALVDTLPLENFSGVTLSCDRGWNLVSLPVGRPDELAGHVFSSLSGPLYSFDGTSYLTADSMKNGRGYWAHFDGNRMFTIMGDTLNTDTVNVTEGWNLIGSITIPAPAGTIASVPPGLVTSHVFGYSNGYKTVDTISPGQGYWIKASQGGQLILDGPGPVVEAKSVIRQILTDAPPPLPGVNGPVKPLPKSYALSQSYPNPFNPTTTIRYQLPVESRVSLKIYNLLGQVVDVLAAGIQSGGFKSVEWNASHLASGVYFYQLQAVSVTDPSRRLRDSGRALLIR